MSRTAKLIIYSTVLIISILLKIKKNQDGSPSVYKPIEQRDTKSTPKPELPSLDEIYNIEDIENPKDTDGIKAYYETPKDGFSPYDDFFGKGIYNNSTGNVFTIQNSNSTDAVVLLVNAISGRKVRNEFIRKGSTFSMTGVPNGTYYLEWASGNDWSPYLKVGRLTGGFRTNASYTKTKDVEDWMKVSGYQEWTVTLYSVVGGDVESEGLTAEEFGT